MAKPIPIARKAFRPKRNVNHAVFKLGARDVFLLSCVLVGVTGGDIHLTDVAFDRRTREVIPLVADSALDNQARLLQGNTANKLARYNVQQNAERKVQNGMDLTVKIPSHFCQRRLRAGGGGGGCKIFAAFIIST